MERKYIYFAKMNTEYRIVLNDLIFCDSLTRQNIKKVKENISNGKINDLRRIITIGNKKYKYTFNDIGDVYIVKQLS